MDIATVARFSRQIALPDVGPEGQARICAARVLVAGAGLAAETAATYLAAAGVGRVIARETPPVDGGDWLAALAGVDLIVRIGFDDDAMLGAAKRLGLPVVVVRATPAQVDLVSFSRRAPAPETPLDGPAQAAAAVPGEAADVLAGTLAAAEALVRIARIDGSAWTELGSAERSPSRGGSGTRSGSPTNIGRTRHLRFPLDGGAPLAQQIGVLS
ncbi:MAG TPA: ThiF family adenylyltransferase [Polyangia bacterium]|nr:ThiF family adenylyltransferase [Polyangia bacterium]